MCLSTVYVKNNGQVETAMQDVSRMVAKNDGMLLVGMFGDETFVNGRIESIDYLDGKTTILKNDSMK